MLILKDCKGESLAFVSVAFFLSIGIVRMISEYAKDGLGEDFATFLQEIDHLSEYIYSL